MVSHGNPVVDPSRNLSPDGECAESSSQSGVGPLECLVGLIGVYGDTRPMGTPVWFFLWMKPKRYSNSSTIIGVYFLCPGASLPTIGLLGKNIITDSKHF